MNITIEKLTNGYVVTINGKRTFCDVPEAICGMTSEAVLAECERLDKGATDFAAEFEKVMREVRQPEAGQFPTELTWVSGEPVPRSKWGKLLASWTTT